MVHYSLFPTAIGDCGIAWRGDTVIASSLPEITAADTSVRLAAQTGATKREPTAYIRRAIRAITALLEGERTDLSFIDCDFSKIESFSEKVYAATRQIPIGETLTYGDIAAQLGNNLLAQKVGQVLGRNPFPIIVPCHRVIGANGKLTGFSAHGGIETKHKLLTIEGAIDKALMGEQLELFGRLDSSSETKTIPSSHTN